MVMALPTRCALCGPVIGAKPERFCRWVLDLIGYTSGDTMDDIFPGSYVMDRVVAQGVLEL
jgi:DNA-directed RNA polymerase subunit N (RpoN/RPB10)